MDKTDLKLDRTKTLDKNHRLTKIGISGWVEPLIGKIDYFEIDAFDPVFDSSRNLSSMMQSAANTASFGISAGFYFLRGEESAVRERTEILAERCGWIQAESCVVKVSDSVSIEQVVRLTDEWMKHSVCSLYLDYGSTTATRDHLKSRHLVCDPLWETPRRSDYWRVHGWHPERWVRKYSEEAMVGLAQKTAQYQPKVLVFAHSQRVVQSKQFVKEFRKHL